MRPDVGVIVVAAGQGHRFGGETPKQYLPLHGVPVVLRAMRPFLMHPEVEQVVLVLPPGDQAMRPEWLGPMIGGPLSVVDGGAVRSASVRAGMAALNAACEIVLIHDGARPLVTTALIDAVIAQTRTGACAVPALPVTDTLKRADASLRVTGTVPREQLWRAQTPQGFPRDLLERAMQAHGDQPGLTDDAMLAEILGEPVTLVPGSPHNIKITTPDDLALAGWYLGTS